MTALLLKRKEVDTGAFRVGVSETDTPPGGQLGRRHFSVAQQILLQACLLPHYLQK